MYLMSIDDYRSSIDESSDFDDSKNKVMFTPMVLLLGKTVQYWKMTKLKVLKY